MSERCEHHNVMQSTEDNDPWVRCVRCAAEMTEADWRRLWQRRGARVPIRDAVPVWTPLPNPEQGIIDASALLRGGPATEEERIRSVLASVSDDEPHPEWHPTLSREIL